jgi:uncharacterized protein YdhG (YjbR/CyaY superfamily)
MTPAKKVVKKAAPKKGKLFSAEEQAAMTDYVKELKREQGRGGKPDKNEDEAVALAAIAALKPPDKALAERLHALIAKTAPDLAPKTWYGMPAYAKDGKVVCFFQSGAKFKTRYATLGFSDKANLDEGQMWPTSYALKQLTGTEEAKIVALLKKALS